MFHSAISGLFMPKLPSNLFFLNCSQCRRWPKVPLELFQKIEALTQGWPFLKALALLQGFSPSSRLSIFSSIAFSGYFNPATLFLFHLRCSLWPRPSFILRLGTFWTPPAFAWWWGRAGLPTVGAAGAAALLVLPFLKAFCLPFFKAFCLPFPKAFCLPFPKATPLIPGWSWQRNMGSIPENWTAWI